MPSFLEFAAPRAEDEMATGVSVRDIQTKRPLLLSQDGLAGCGGFVWIAGKRLASYLLQQSICQPGLLANKRVVELGTGTGVVGLALGTSCDLGATGKIYVTDVKCNQLNAASCKLIIKTSATIARGKHSTERCLEHGDCNRITLVQRLWRYSAS